MSAFDLVVVGSGSAAGAVASRCRAAGWSVAMIDKQPFGGTCVLRGCDPKKVLVSAAAAVDGARALSGKGVHPGDVAIDWAALMTFKRTFTDSYSDRRKTSLRRSGIETFDGAARFIGPARLEVGGLPLEATRAIVIASGARPADLSIDGREHVITSDQFLELASLPSSVTFIGGGYISFEFAHVAARAGARVTILHRGKRPLSDFDGDLVDRLVARTTAAGIDVRVGTEVRSVERTDNRYQVAFRDAGGKSGFVETDLVVHGAGRVPDLDDLALEAGGVRYSRAGVEVNAYLQSVSNALVWAAGDCAATDGPPLTPVAGYEGRIVATNLLEGRSLTADYSAIPSVVFTLPPLARVGLIEAEARAAGLDIRVSHQDTASWHSSRRVGEDFSAFKVLVETTTNRILGAHVLGPLADETINLFALAMRAGMTANQFKDMLWAYPTHASDTPYMV
jgi:glutathione reductase (NADPH)